MDVLIKAIYRTGEGRDVGVVRVELLFLGRQRLLGLGLQLAALLRTPAAQPHLQGVHSSCCAHLAAPAR